jgi:hypothetical protein
LKFKGWPREARSFKRALREPVMEV